MHQPVLLAETLQWLNPGPKGWWVDCTVGGGGHTEALLQATAPEGQVLGLDRDQAAIARVQERLAGYGDRCRLVQANYRELARVVKENQIAGISGVMMDLGVSSFQLDTAARGFSFLQDGPLDMRMDLNDSRTAADIVNYSDERELADIFYTYGEERFSRQLAHAIVRQRPIRTTTQLAELAKSAIRNSGGIHPATRAFQALRIVVNEELQGLEAGVAAAQEVLLNGGRLVVLSFHSLEDRIVKQAFRTPGWERLIKKVVRPSEAETRQNPRSRSARLRAAMRVRE